MVQARGNERLCTSREEPAEPPTMMIVLIGAL